MCYSAHSSISNYVYVAVISSILCYYGNSYDKHVALFFFVVIQMQMAEFFMHLDQKCGWVNKMATISAFVILFIQPISAYVLGHMLDTITMPDEFQYIYISYAFYGLIQLVVYLKNNNRICSRIKKGNLIWGFGPRRDINGIINTVLYLLLTTLPWLYLDSNVKYLVIAIWLGSWLLHFFMYPQHWGSMWCFFVSGIITIYAVARFLQYIQN